MKINSVKIISLLFFILSAFYLYTAYQIQVFSFDEDSPFNAKTFPIYLGYAGMFFAGLKIALPIGYEAQVRPRSGLAAKHGISVLNSPGTIDADYRGEVGVILINLSNDAFTINPGERIAQLVLAKHEQIQWKIDKKNYS